MNSFNKNISYKFRFCFWHIDMAKVAQFFSKEYSDFVVLISFLFRKYNCLCNLLNAAEQKI